MKQQDYEVAICYSWNGVRWIKKAIPKKRVKRQYLIIPPAWEKWARNLWSERKQ